MTRALLRFIAAVFVWRRRYEGVSLTPYESVLAKDWNTSEEDAAWAYLSEPFGADTDDYHVGTGGAGKVNCGDGCKGCVHCWAGDDWTDCDAESTPMHGKDAN